MKSGSWSNEGSRNVGFREILSLEKKRFATIARQRVGTTVAQIQTGWMSAFAESNISVACELYLLGIHCHDFDLGLLDEQIELPASSRAFSGLDDNGGLQGRDRAKQALRCVGNGLGEGRRFWFPQENRDENGRVDNHE